MSMPNTFSRPDKPDHKATVLYEIDMLRFAVREVAGSEPGQKQWAFLECFLLHFRNLIEFLGKWTNIRDDDLLVRNIWEQIHMPPPPDIERIHGDGRKLLEKYERRDDSISRYLQHCTTQRTHSKDWRVGAMYRELNPLLREVENAMGVNRPDDYLVVDDRIAYGSPIMLGPESYSTTSVTQYTTLIDESQLGAITAKVKPSKDGQK